MRLKLSQIRIDGGTQPRAKMCDDTVLQYMDDLIDGHQLPPVDVYHDGKDYWLADGFHRFRAHQRAKRADIAVTLHQGTRRDAVLHSVGANATHGLPRTNEDKRRAVTTLIRDPEWSGWAHRDIAKRCNVTEAYVRKLRTELSAHSAQIAPTPAERRFVRNGKEHTMKTGNIGKSAGAKREAIVTAPVGYESEPVPEPERSQPDPQPEPEDPDTALQLDEEPELDSEPVEPWADFNAQVDVLITQLRAVANGMRKTLEAEGPNLRSPWAHYMSHAGTVGAINSVVKHLQDNRPSVPDAKAPGYLPVRIVAARTAYKGGR